MKGLINIPNIITCLNLISGCFAIVSALQGDYETAFAWIIAGAVFDFFDGMAARLLGVSSPVGKELDSLADVVTFGVAPSAILYSFGESFYAGVTCMFPTLLPYHFAFVMAALFWASLIVGCGDWIQTLPYKPLILLLMMGVSCWLLVSEIPMFALKFKHWGWRGNEIRYAFLLSCLPLLAIFGIAGIAVIVAWYVALSILTNFTKNHSKS